MPGSLTGCRRWSRTGTTSISRLGRTRICSRSTLRLVLGERAGLPLADLPEQIRLRHRGNIIFAFNYGPDTWTDPDGRIVGGATVNPFDWISSCPAGSSAG